VLAAQNAVDFRNIGVATSGSTLFRQIGGSIGVSMFGAIFANRLGHELVSRLPHGVRIPKVANPELVKQLPPSVHAPYIEAFASSLRPVFLVAAGISVLAFGLTWLLREVPLREQTRLDSVADAIPPPVAEAREPAPAVATAARQK